MKLLLRGSILCLGLLCIWQALVTTFNLPDYILPSPLQVFYVLTQQSELIAKESVPTIIETLLGFVLGILVGCMVGAAIAYFRPVRFWFLPLLIISQAIPIFAIAPLFVIWLGYGLASKIAITVLMILFPIASAAFDGLQKTDPGWLDLAKTMNASPGQIFWQIRVPASLPTLASGIRIAAVYAPIGAIVGEWVGASQGLGFLMINANARTQIDVMFAALLVIILLALLLYFVVDKTLRKWVWW